MTNLLASSLSLEYNSRMKKMNFRSEKGIGLIEVMVAIGLLAVVAAGVSGLGKIQMKQQTQTNVTFQADSFRRQLMSNLNNSSAWKATINDATNSKLSCLQSGGTCTILPAPVAPATKSTPLPFYFVYDASGNKFYDGSAGHGLTSQTQPCSSFNGNPGSGSDQCPYRFELGWIPHCTVGTNAPGSSCAAANTQAEIVVTALYNAGTSDKSVAFNSSNYSADFYQGASNLSCAWDNNGGNLTETCASSIGIGTLSPNATYALDVQNTTGGSGLNVNGIINTTTGITTPYVTYTSDARLKTDLQSVQGMENLFQSLHPLRYRWNEKAASLGLRDTEEHLGLLAQDVEKSFPEAVKVDHNGVKSVDYALMVVPAIQAIKELQQQNKLLLQRVQSLENSRTH